MTEWIITYANGEKEYVRGYNLFMAVSSAKKQPSDNIKMVERIWN